MKMDCLILGIFLINSFVNLTEYHSMTFNNEQTFTDLKMGENYYFTIQASKEIKYYAVKIKIPSSEFSSPTSLLLSYMSHYTEKISSIIDKGNLTLSFSIDNNYNTYESSSCSVNTWSSKYISFLLITKYDIGSASIMISEGSSGIGFFITFLIVFSSLLTIVLFIITTIGFILRGCTIIAPKNESSPQLENNTSSLTDQLNQQPEPQISNIEQNGNGYTPDQLQINN